MYTRLDRIVDTLEALYGEKLSAVILFGSSVYAPHKARDIDLIVIVQEHLMEDLVQEHVAVKSRLLRSVEFSVDVDAHIFTLEEFKKNLVPGTFLTGLVLGFKVLLDRCNIREIICDFVRQIVNHPEHIILANRHGVFNLKKIGKALLPVLCSES